MLSWLRRVRFLFGRSQMIQRTFDLWQQLGFHVSENHYYQPIPDTRSLPDHLWAEENELTGIDMHEEAQLVLLDDLTERYGPEHHDLGRKEKTGYSFDNAMFGPVDAEIYYSLVRDLKPRTLIEVGAGHSTKVALAAVDRNRRENASYDCDITAVEPCPTEDLEQLPVTLIQERVEQGDRSSLFGTLSSNDVLFIDSSHVSRIGGDVNYLLLNVLPRVAKGTVIHFHDIFLPSEYPADWIKRRHWFFTEQYMLQAFLSFNTSFEVLWSSHLMMLHHGAKLRSCFRSLDAITSIQPNSLWLRRIN